MRMAHQFIAGTTPDEAVASLETLWTSGRAFTCDLLGEKTIIDDEAGRYAHRVVDLLTAVPTPRRAGRPARPSARRPRAAVPGEHLDQAHGAGDAL